MVLEKKARKMNPEKLKQLQAQVRIGGKGSMRRKKKIVHSNQAADEKKLKVVLDRVSASPMPMTKEAIILKNDSTAIYFNNPKVQVSLSRKTFVISGQCEKRGMPVLVPRKMNQHGANSTGATPTDANEGNDDDIPDIVENFEKLAMGAPKAPKSNSE